MRFSYALKALLINELEVEGRGRGGVVSVRHEDEGGGVVCVELRGRWQSYSQGARALRPSLDVSHGKDGPDMAHERTMHTDVENKSPPMAGMLVGWAQVRFGCQQIHNAAVTHDTGTCTYFSVVRDRRSEMCA